MRQVRKSKGISLWLVLPGIFLLCSCARGTEVGNGNRPTDPNDPNKEANTSGPMPEADKASGSDSPWLDWLLAPCGSPLREIRSQLLGVPDTDDRLHIETNGELRDLNYFEQSWQLEPVKPEDADDFRIIVRNLDQAANSDVAHSNRYQCGQVRSSADRSARRMEITKDQQVAELIWYRQPESQAITRIEIVWDTGRIELVGIIASD